jgi:hypothetical protein
VENGTGILYSFNRDVPVPERFQEVSVDLGAIGNFKSWRIYPEIIGKVAEVHTNRAHVAIAGLLLNKKVVVYTSGYHKLKSLYEFTLRGLGNATYVE